MKIYYKLPLMVVGGTVLTGLLLGFLAVRMITLELYRDATDSLTALRSSRHAALMEYLTTLEQFMTVLANGATSDRALGELEVAFDSSNLSDAERTAILQGIYNPKYPDGDRKRVEDSGAFWLIAYHETHRNYHGWFETLRREADFYDVFLVNRRGEIVYSVAKEVDFASNLLDGPWRNSGLGRAVARVLQPRRDVLRHSWSDFTYYEPSGNAPAAFLAAPILRNNTVVGAIAAQIPSGRLSRIMNVNAGMGRTGETFIVGSDYLMRSESRFETGTTLSQSVANDVVDAALAGREGVGQVDNYVGRPVLASFQPVAFPAFRWAIIAEKDMAEIDAPIAKVRDRVILVGILVMLTVATLGLLFAIRVSRPLAQLSGAITEFTATRKAAEIEGVSRGDELGEIARAFSELSRETEAYIGELNAARARAAEASEQLRLALDNMPAGMSMYDRDLKVVVSNDKAHSFLDYPAELMAPGRSIVDAFRFLAERGDYGPGAVEELVRERREVYARGEPSVREVRTRSGRIVDIRTQPIGDGGTVVVFDDVTERRQAEEAVAEKEAQLRVAMDYMPGGMCMVDDDLRIVVYNDQIRELFNFPEECFRIGESILAARRFQAARGDFGEIDDAAVVADTMALFASGASINYERRLRDGRHISVGANPAPSGGSVIVCTDITERKKAEEELRKAYTIIRESVQYASKMQRSLLPAPEDLSALGEHMMIWEPRDVGGGDLFWLRQIENGTLVIVGDGTGHGVPGAFMTLVATSALNQALLEHPDGDPATLLQHMNAYVKYMLRQDVEAGEADDGMELGICRIDRDSNDVTFAGARFSLIQVAGGEARELKGDKGGIGYRRVPIDTAFSNHALPHRPGGAYYLVTDGFVDQIGGPRRRAFGKRRLFAKLLEVQSSPMAEQRRILIQTLEAYRGEEPRRDDVTVVGFKVGRTATA